MQLVIRTVVLTNRVRRCDTYYVLFVFCVLDLIILSITASFLLAEFAIILTYVSLLSIAKSSSKMEVANF